MSSCRSSRYLLLIFVLILLAAFDIFSAITVHDTLFRSSYDKTEQRYKISYPDGLAAGNSVDLLIALHGHGSDRHQCLNQDVTVLRDEFRAAQTIAGERKMIYVSPDYRCCTSWMGPAAESDLIQLIGLLKAHHRIKRVFLTGASMGGASCLEFTLLHSDMIQGVASMNGVVNFEQYRQSFAGISDSISKSFGGPLGEIPKVYHDRSALFFPEKFTMPVSFTADSADQIVDPQSIWQFSDTLRSRGKKDIMLISRAIGHRTKYADARAIINFVVDQALLKEKQNYSDTNVALFRYPVGAITAGGWLDTQLTRSARQLGSRLADFEYGIVKAPLWDRTSDGRWMNNPGWAPFSAGFNMEMAAKYLYGQVLLAYTSDDSSLKATVTAWVNHIISPGFREPDGYLGGFTRTDNRGTDYHGYGADYEILSLLNFFEANPSRTDVLNACHDGIHWFVRNWNASTWAGEGKQAGYVGQTIIEAALETYKYFPKDTAILNWCNTYLEWLNAHSPLPVKLSDYLSDKYPDNHCVAYGLTVRIPALLSSFGPSKLPYRTAAVMGLEKVVSGEFMQHGGPSTPGERTSRDIGPSSDMESGCNSQVWSQDFAMMAALTGETKWADRLEKIIFNAAEGSRKKDEKAVPYFIRSNQYATPNDITGFQYGPNCFVPCCVTASIGVLPEFTRSLFMHNSQGDIYAVAYAPSVLKAGTKNLLTETTDYPFGKTVKLTFNQPFSHALNLRIPGWSAPNTVIKVNGARVSGTITPGTYFKVLKPGGAQWLSGDVIEMSLNAMDSVRVVRTTLRNKPFVSLEIGPLLFAYDIPAVWNKVACRGLKTPPADMPWYDIVPSVSVDSVKRYFLPGTDNQIKNAVTVHRNPIAGYPWEKTNIWISVPVNGGSSRIDLIPFGCTTLRKSYFPAHEEKLTGTAD